MTDKNHLDGRPHCHWNENFEIYYLDEKMRSQKDPEFSHLYDRVGRGAINDEDEKFLRSRVKCTKAEEYNENFKSGILSIIVTTHKKKDLFNSPKLANLLPDENEYVCNSIDRVTNLPNRKLPSRLKDNPGRTGNLQTELRLKVGTPVFITSNHSKNKYKDDGIVSSVGMGQLASILSGILGILGTIKKIKYNWFFKIL